jgi:hypothetical protein
MQWADRQRNRFAEILKGGSLGLKSENPLKRLVYRADQPIATGKTDPGFAIHPFIGYGYKVV